MPNVRCFLWRRLNRHLVTQLRDRWRFTDARRFTLGKIFRNTNFWWLCMSILRGRFFCVGFLCLPYKCTPPLFLRCWRGGVLRLLRVQSCARILCAQARQLLGCWHIRYERTLRQRLPNRRFCSIICCFLSESTPSKFLRCWGWRMLRHFRFRTQSYIICA